MSESRRERWSKLVAEQQASGQAALPFCRERGIAVHSFYRWRRQLGDDEPVRFALLETRKPIAEIAAPLELLFTNGERLRIGNQVDAAVLRLVLGAVRQ
jgi:hypothetical protein